MVEDVRWSGGRTTGASQFSISSTGSLIYLIGFAGASRQATEIVLSDRQGNVQRLPLPAGRYSSPPRVSPDGARIAFGTDDGKEAVIYVYPLSGASSMHRITFGSNNRFPIWSDNQRLAFQSDREGDLAIWQSGVGGSAKRLTKPGPGESHAPEAWSPKADVLLFSMTKGSDISLWTFSPSDGKVSQFGGVHSVYPTGARFSPDGRWVAYTTRERESTTRVLVQPFPATGDKYELLVQGANASPHKVAWSPDGKELFYVPRIFEFEAVSVTTTPTFSFGNAARVPRPFQPGAPNGRTLFDVTPDGKFVGPFLPGSASAAVRVSPSIQVVLNWFEELRARVPRNPS
jgi:serine/threonine-protein kinase